MKMELAYDELKPEKLKIKTPLILLHGANSWRKTWNKFDLAQKLADCSGSKIYAIDLRNHGDSPWSDEFSLEIMANDVVCFMNKRQIKSAIMIGHSLGGAVAMMVALLKPELVEKLIAEDVSPRPLPPEKKILAVQMVKLFKNSVKLIPPDLDLPSAKKFISDFCHKQITKDCSTPNQDEGVNLPLTKINGEFCWKTNITVLERTSLSAESLKFPQATNNKPALFIYGQKSLLFNINTEREYVLEKFPLAKLQEVNGASHNIHTEYPEDFLSLIISFLAQY